MGMVVGLLISTSTVACSPATHCTGPSGSAGSRRAEKGVKMNGPFASPVRTRAGGLGGDCLCVHAQNTRRMVLIARARRQGREDE